MKKIVYMHMAKTAGSSVNRFFENALGRENCINHVERFPLEQRLEYLERSAYLSGHIYSSDIFQLTKNRDDIYIFTFMRDPLKQIASHIHWLDHYNDPPFRKESERFGEALRQVIEALRVVDLNSPDELDELMTNLPPWGLRMLDNMQTRYMCGERRSIPLSLINARTAFRVSGRFDRIGFVEDMDVSLAAIANDLGLPIPEAGAPRVNEAKSSRTLDLSLPVVRTVLGKRIIADQRLYALARRREAERDGTDRGEVSGQTEEEATPR